MSDDLISRQAAIEACLNGWNYDMETIKHIQDNISRLPSVQPKKKTGKWLHDQGKYKNRWICTECSYRWYFPKEEAKYCPNCGAKMEG